MLYVYKILEKKKKKNRHKEPGYLLQPSWAFYPQLCIYRFCCTKCEGEEFCVRQSVPEVVRCDRKLAGVKSGEPT